MKKCSVGGQAVMEGVMMKAPGGIAMAVRDAKGRIILDYKEYQTKAQKGDKTMMDALIPAVEAMQNSDTADVKELLLSAADAALKGAEDTVRMKANFGRARNYGEQSIGYADSGATSWSCMFAAFAEAL